MREICSPEAHVRRCSAKQVLLNISQNLENVPESLFCCPQPAILLKKGIGQRSFPTNFTKCLQKPILQNTSGQLHFLLLSKSLTSIFRIIYLQYRIYSGTSGA